MTSQFRLKNFGKRNYLTMAINFHHQYRPHLEGFHFFFHWNAAHFLNYLHLFWPIRTLPATCPGTFDGRTLKINNTLRKNISKKLYGRKSQKMSKPSFQHELAKPNNYETHFFELGAALKNTASRSSEAEISRLKTFWEITSGKKEK